MNDHITLTRDEANGLLRAIDQALAALREDGPESPATSRLAERRTWLAEEFAKSEAGDSPST
ncbi:MAG: hypothetical protein ABI658_31240 [Acidimicrobiales bacterium]